MSIINLTTANKNTILPKSSTIVVGFTPVPLIATNVSPTVKRVNSIIAVNDSLATDIALTIEVYKRDFTVYADDQNYSRVIRNRTILSNSSNIVLRNSPIFLEDRDFLLASSNNASNLKVITSYDEISQRAYTDAAVTGYLPGSNTSVLSAVPGVDLIVVGGGGGGGDGNPHNQSFVNGGGGGGGGGILYNSSTGSLTIATYCVVIGAGGAMGSPGSSSCLGTLVAGGGGRGGANTGVNFCACTGTAAGGGGGGGERSVAGKAGSNVSVPAPAAGGSTILFCQFYTPPIGYCGSIPGTGGSGSGGSGGAGGGAARPGATLDGNGGNGGQYSSGPGGSGLGFPAFFMYGTDCINTIPSCPGLITPKGFFGGGGGGAGWWAGGGGRGGGGNGNGSRDGSNQPGDPNTGGGGGGGGFGFPGNNNSVRATPGGSGTVIIRYPLEVSQNSTGGNILLYAGYKYHFFANSGTFNFTT